MVADKSGAEAMIKSVNHPQAGGKNGLFFLTFCLEAVMISPSFLIRPKDAGITNISARRFFAKPSRNF